MTNRISTIMICLFCALAVNAQTTKPFSIGEIKTINSKILAENRTLNIYLPDEYNSKERYPVIYLLDGSANEDFLHIVGLVQFYNMTFKMPKTIIVGIANVDRKRDFTHQTKNAELKKNYPTTGGSAKFIDFIEKELQPYIKSNYKTNDSTYLIGQSLGGLVATEILLKKPQLFSNFIIVSPSLWWDDESLLKQAPVLLTGHSDIKKWVYVSVGAEGKEMEDGAAGLVKAMKNSGKKNMKTDFVPLLKENHATILHNSIYEAFNILYPYKK
ncbi:MAG: alpha/beta hydrolase [Chitinophagaceae bacterium]|nr:alpha/beta hydrolase [Chitinophagaceae bacterium]